MIVFSKVPLILPAEYILNPSYPFSQFHCHAFAQHSRLAWTATDWPLLTEFSTSSSPIHILPILLLPAK